VLLDNHGDAGTVTVRGLTMLNRDHIKVYVTLAYGLPLFPTFLCENWLIEPGVPMELVTPTHPLLLRHGEELAGWAHGSDKVSVLVWPD
jgi:hypothetical protein